MGSPRMRVVRSYFGARAVATFRIVRSPESALVDFPTEDLARQVHELGAEPPSEELLEALLAHARETDDTVLRGLIVHYLLVQRIAQELLVREERVHQAAGQPPDELLQLARLVLQGRGG